MVEELILAHDIGTSGVKSSVMAPDCSMPAATTTAHSTSFPAPGCAEQNPADWWDGVCRNTRRLVAENPGFRSRIAGIGVSGHMLGCLPVDAAGNPLTPCLIHSDCRATAEQRDIARQFGADAIYGITGNVLDARSPLCKMLWLRRHEAARYQAAARFLQSKDYVVGRLVGSFDSTDYSDASHAQILDVNRCCYAGELLSELGLDVGKLPQLHRSIDVAGTLCPEAAAAQGLPAGIPVAAGGGDGACATVGAGAAAAGCCYCCLGTTAWISCTNPGPVFDSRRRLFNIMGLDGERCGLYGTVQAAGRAVHWVMDLLGETDFSALEPLLETALPGSNGLLFLPYLEGERSPIWDADARGVFFGLSSSHGRPETVRAVVEGVTFALRSVLQALREQVAVPRLRLIGGGARSPVWQQLLADVCDVELQLPTSEVTDITSLGAAVAAGVAVGLFESLESATAGLASAERRLPDAAVTAAYRPSWELYQALYEQLQPLFPRLAAIAAQPR